VNDTAWPSKIGLHSALDQEPPVCTGDVCFAFLPRDAMHSAAYAVGRILSVCHVPLLYRNMLKLFVNRLLSPPFYFFHTKHWRNSDEVPLNGDVELQVENETEYLSCRREARATLHVSGNFSKLLKVTQGHSKLHR